MDLLVVYFVLYLLALVCLVVATIGTKSPRFNLMALGLALAVAVPFIQTLHRL